MVMEYTPNFNIPLPEFDKARWQDDYYTGMRIIDAVIGQYVTAKQVKGVWKNSTAYEAGDTVIGVTDGSIFQAAANHTSPPVPTTFAAARAANPNLWSKQGLQERFRGTWQSGLLYGTGDFVVYQHIYAVAVTPHTSSGSFATDISNWDYLVDLTNDLAQIAADRLAAQNAAAAALTSENNAEAAAAASAADAAQTALDRIQTGQDAVATAADAAQTGDDRTVASASAVAAATSEANAAASAATIGNFDLTGTPAEDDVIQWNTAAGKWIRRTIAQLKAALGLGTAAYQNTSAFQAADTSLTSIAGLTNAANQIIYTTGSETFANAPISAGGRALINTTAATNAIPYYTSTSAASTFTSTAAGRAFVGLTGAADTMGYFTSASAAATTALTAYARTLLDDAEAATARATLLVGQHVEPGGRLSLTTGVPVTLTDVTGASTLYYTPYKHPYIWLYVSSVWTPLTFTERSIALSGLTSGRPYDVFGYSNAGVLTLELLSWTNATTRATALTRQDGVLVKSGDASRRYLGTIYTTGTTTTEDSRSKRFVWNYYNRCARKTGFAITDNLFTYSTATWQQFNATAGYKFEFIRGVDEDSVKAWTGQFQVQSSTATFRSIAVSWGLDSTSSPSTGAMQIEGRINNAAVAYIDSMYDGYPGEGYHYLALLQKGGGTDTQSWFNNNSASAAYANQGCMGEVWA